MRIILIAEGVNFFLHLIHPYHMTAFLLYLKFYLLFVLFFLVLFLLGHLAFKPLGRFIKPGGFYLNIFLRTLLGLTLAVVLYTAFVTGLKTVNIAFVLLFVFVFNELRLYKKKSGEVLTIYPRQEKPGTRELVRRISGLLILSLAIYLWFAQILINHGSDFGFFLPDKGKIYYANLSDMLFTGQENRWGTNNLLDPYYHGVAPYHYFELWLNAMFSRISAAPGIVSFYVFTYPFLNFVAALGLLAVLERSGKVSALKNLLIFPLLFVGGLYFNTSDPDFAWSMNFGESSMEYMGEKYAAYYPFIILSFLLFAEGYLVLAMAALLFLPVVTISTLPGVFAAMVLFLTISFFTKQLARKEILRLFLYLFTLGSALALFYNSLGATDNPYFVHGIFHYTDAKDLSLNSIKISMVELAYRIWDDPLRFLLLHAAFVPFIVLVWRAKFLPGYKPLLLFTGLMYLVSLLLYGAFYKLFDGIQFYTNDFTFINVFAALTIIYFMQSDRSISSMARKGLLAFLVLLLGFKVFYAYGAHQKNISENQVYSDAYMGRVKQMSERIESKQLVGALFGGGPEEMNLHNDDKSGISCFYLAYLPVFYPGIDLSVYDIHDWSREPELAEVQKASVEQSPFTRFVNGQKKNFAFTSIEQSQLDFIKQQHIQYLVISRHARLNPLIEDVIAEEIKDSLSGERFVRLAW